MPHPHSSNKNNIHIIFLSGDLQICMAAIIYYCLDCNNKLDFEAITIHNATNCCNHNSIIKKDCVKSFPHVYKVWMTCSSQAT